MNAKNIYLHRCHKNSLWFWMLTQNPHGEPDHVFLDTHPSPFAAIKSNMP